MRIKQSIPQQPGLSRPLPVPPGLCRPLPASPGFSRLLPAFFSFTHRAPGASFHAVPGPVAVSVTVTPSQSALSPCDVFDHSPRSNQRTMLESFMSIRSCTSGHETTFFATLDPEKVQSRNGVFVIMYGSLGQCKASRCPCFGNDSE